MQWKTTRLVRERREALGEILLKLFLKLVSIPRPKGQEKKIGAFFSGPNFDTCCKLSQIHPNHPNPPKLKFPLNKNPSKITPLDFQKYEILKNLLGFANLSKYHYLYQSIARGLYHYQTLWPVFFSQTVRLALPTKSPVRTRHMYIRLHTPISSESSTRGSSFSTPSRKWASFKHLEIFAIFAGGGIRYAFVESQFILHGCNGRPRNLEKEMVHSRNHKCASRPDFGHLLNLHLGGLKR